MLKIAVFCHIRNVKDNIIVVSVQLAKVDTSEKR